MNKIRIVHIITDLKPGGAETMLLKLLSSLDSDIYDLFVISLMDLGDIGLKLKSYSIPVFTIGAKEAISGEFYSLDSSFEISSSPYCSNLHHADLLGGLALLSCCHKIIWGLRHSDLSLKHNKTSTI